jgi:uncharacterized protein YccT (UPF0319 family)
MKFCVIVMLESLTSLEYISMCYSSSTNHVIDQLLSEGRQKLSKCLWSAKTHFVTDDI